MYFKQFLWHIATFAILNCSRARAHPGHHRWQHGGLQSFDNVAAALLVVLQYVLTDHGYDSLHLALAAEPGTAALIWPLFAAATVFGTLLALGMCVTAVLEAHRRIATRDTARHSNMMVGAAANRADPVAGKLAAERTGGGGHGRVHPNVQPSGGTGPAAAALAAAAADQSAHGAARRVQNSLLYRRGVALLIVLHTAAIAADAGEPPASLRVGIAAVYVVANGLFCADYLISYLGTVRRLDFVIQPSSLAEVVLLACGLAGLWRGSVSLSAVPAARVLRLASRVPALAVLMHRALSGGPALAQLSLVAGVACAAAATAGRYIVGAGQLGESRAGYGTMLDALLTTFQLLTGDGWRCDWHPPIYYHILVTFFCPLFMLFTPFTEFRFRIAVGWSTGPWRRKMILQRARTWGCVYLCGF